MSSERTNSDRYVVWRSGPALTSELYIDGLYDDFEGLRLLLRGRDFTQSAVRIRFADRYAYRYTNESDRLRTWARHPEISQAVVYEVENSSWLEWLFAESGETLPLRQLKHFAVYSVEDCVDVISGSEPEIALVG